jgi:DNA polymerase-3 subunit beta
MKFVCNQSDFNTTLSLVSRVVPSRPTHPILGNVLLVADSDQGRVNLTAFDLSLGIHASFNAEVSEGGQATLPAKLLNDIISRLSDCEVQLVTEVDKQAGEAMTEQPDDSITATLTADSGRFQIRGMSAAGFPDLPTADEGEVLKLPATALLEGLRGVLFATSTDETKQVLTGVHLTGTQDSLEFAATDAHRLAVVETPLENSETTIADFSMTIPARALRELERMIVGQKGANNNVTLHVSDSQVIFELNGSRITSRKLEGAYPPYRQLIPSQLEYSAVIERRRLLSSLERVAVLADQKNNVVTFTLDNSGLLTISGKATDLGSAIEELPVETKDDGTISFSVKYLLDGLKAIPDNDIIMRFNGQNQPVIFVPLSGVKMTYLVMPIMSLKN